MKIAILNSLYTPHLVGGAERSVQILAEALTRQGQEVIVITTKPGSDVEVKYVNEVKLYYLGLRNFYWPYSDKNVTSIEKFAWHILDINNPIMAGQVGKILDKEKPDILHTNNLSGFSIGVWKKAASQSIPIIHTARDYYLLCPKTTMYDKGRNCTKPCLSCYIFSILKRIASKQVSAFVPNSEFVLQQHTKNGFFINTKIKKTIANPMQYKNIVPRAYQKEDKKIIFGYLGRLEPAKGIEQLLKAITKLQYDTWELWIGGTGSQEYIQGLKAKYPNDRIHFCGFVNTEDFLQHIDVMVVPSQWSEPIPRSIIESYMYGLPVIASNRGGIPEIVEDGKTGFLFSAENPDSLTRELENFIQNPNYLQPMGLSALEKSKDFLPETIASQWAIAYRQVIDG